MKIAQNLNELLNANPGNGMIVDTIYAFITGLAYSEGWEFKLYQRKVI